MILELVWRQWTRWSPSTEELRCIISSNIERAYGAWPWDQAPARRVAILNVIGLDMYESRLRITNAPLHFEYIVICRKNSNKKSIILFEYLLEFLN